MAVDVIETRTHIIIRTAVAGVKPDDLDVNVTNDLVTIRGEREQVKEAHDATVHFSECFWGRFSRSIILPHAVKPDEAEADMKNGILTLTIPKARGEMKVRINEIEN